MPSFDSKERSAYLQDPLASNAADSSRDSACAGQYYTTSTSAIAEKSEGSSNHPNAQPVPEYADDGMVDEDYARGMAAAVEDREEYLAEIKEFTEHHVPAPAPAVATADGWASPVQKGRRPQKISLEDAINPGGVLDKPKLSVVEMPKGKSVKLHPYEQWYTSADLAAMKFDEPEWIVPNILGLGFHILAGPPKAGKSWMAFDLGLSVGRGGAWLNGLPVDRRMVIYVALEDGPQRLQGRMSVLYPEGVEMVKTLRFHHRAPPMPEFLKWLKIQMLSWQTTGLVIVDTFGRISEDKGAKSGYKSDYQETALFQEFADDMKTCVLMLHHTRKFRGGDPFDDISGTYGVTGAADTLLVLETEPTGAGGKLHIRGRDVEQQCLSLAFKDGRWLYQGPTTPENYSQEEQEIVSLLAREPCGLTLAQITGRSRATTEALRSRLRRMKDRGIVALGPDKHWMLTKV